jgi:hypothetical protein
VGRLPDRSWRRWKCRDDGQFGVLLAIANILAAMYAYGNVDQGTGNWYLAGLSVGLGLGGLVPLNHYLSALLAIVGIYISVGTNANSNPSSCGL